MPVAPVSGVGKTPWVLEFVKVSKLVERPLDTLHNVSLLPAPTEEGRWTNRSTSTQEAKKWLLSVLSTTRRHELLQKKPSKEISIDQSQLVVRKESSRTLHAQTVTELEVSNALKRRALAFDLVGVCTYDVMAAYHADLLDHLHTPPPRVLGCVGTTDFAGGQSCLHVLVRENDLLKKECHEPIAFGFATAHHLESAKRRLPLVAIVRKNSKSIIRSQGIESKETVEKSPQTATSEREGRTKGSHRQKSWSKHSSRSRQQSAGSSSKATPLLGIQPAKRLQQSQSRGELYQGHPFVRRAGVFQTPLASRPSLKRSKFHQRLVLSRTADQLSFCIRISSPIERVFTCILHHLAERLLGRGLFRMVINICRHHLEMTTAQTGYRG